MVDVPSCVLQGFAIDIVALIEGKNIGVALGESLGTFFFGNLLPNVLNDPGTLFDLLCCEESLASNPRWTHTYLHLHSVTSWFRDWHHVYMA